MHLSSYRYLIQIVFEIYNIKLRALILGTRENTNKYLKSLPWEGGYIYKKEKKKKDVATKDVTICVFLDHKTVNICQNNVPLNWS
jgi:hypothetical protein